MTGFIQRMVIIGSLGFTILSLLFVATFSLPLGHKGIVWFEKGTHASSMAQLLRDHHLPASALHLWFYKKLSGNHLQKGEYQIQEGWSLWRTCQHIASGQVIMHKLTFPEGWTIHQIAERIAAEPLLVGSIHKMPEEGSVLADTYHFARGETREKFLQSMIQTMKQCLAREWESRDASVHISPAEAVVLASIVECETPKDAEKPLVAGVFYHRLAKNMMLQSDPTVAYALTLGKHQLEEPLTLKDLKTPSPFNTYIQKGIPPSPIACPGRAALRAVLHPTSTMCLYFVADGTGGHAFGTTFEEHQRNIKQWRLVQKRNLRRDVRAAF